MATRVAWSPMSPETKWEIGLLHLIKVTCWEEPNHDCKQRIRGTVKTSQHRLARFSSMKGKAFQTSQIFLYNFMCKLSISYLFHIYVISCSGGSESTNVIICSQALECRTPMWQCRNSQGEGDDEEACGHPEDTDTPLSSNEISCFCGDLTHFALYTQKRWCLNGCELII